MHTQTSNVSLYVYIDSSSSIKEPESQRVDVFVCATSIAKQLKFMCGSGLPASVGLLVLSLLKALVANISGAVKTENATVGSYKVHVKIISIVFSFTW